MNSHAALIDWSEVGSLASGSASVRLPQRVSNQESQRAAGSVTYVPFSGPRLFRQVAVKAVDRTYYLTGPLRVDLDYLSDNTVFASHKSLPVHGYGKSFGEAINAFSEMFDSQYRNLVECDKSELTEGGLKRRLQLERVVRIVK